ncbi:MAG: hypothetical protein SFW09_01190 [Hyphomicrobiaceae bacterium]|nr:hypothetical protein [Hyphomicrobiaceae bacterium]
MDWSLVYYLAIGLLGMAYGVLWWSNLLPPSLLPGGAGPILRIVGAPTTVFCGQARAGKSSLLEFLKNHPVPRYERTYRIETQLIVFHRLEGDRKIVLRNVHDIPADRLEMLSIDLVTLQPRLVLAILDGSVVASDGLDSCDSNRLALYPACLVIEQLELALRAKGESASVKAVGILINKSDVWCAGNAAEMKRVVQLVEARVRSCTALGKAIESGQIRLFVRAIALTHPRDFETPDALEDIARHSARLSTETIMELKGKVNEMAVTAAGHLQVHAQTLRDLLDRVDPRKGR